MPSNIRVWDVRWTLPGNEDKPAFEERFRKLLRKEAKFWCFQLERGHQCGLLHFQGRVSLNNAASSSGTLVKRWKVGSEGSDWDFSITSNDNTRNFDYQLKEDTRVRGPWTDKDSEGYIPRQWRFDPTMMHPWQNSIKATLETWDPRAINVLYDPEGAQGKSTIAHICRLTRKCYILKARGKADNMLADFLCKIMARRERQPAGVFVDLTRSCDQKNLRNLYDALEEIKNGYVEDPRYSLKEWDFDSPVVWVMCNSLPNPYWLSLDRWKFWVIGEDRDLERVPFDKATEMYREQTKEQQEHDPSSDLEHED